MMHAGDATAARRGEAAPLRTKGCSSIKKIRDCLARVRAHVASPDICPIPVACALHSDATARNKLHYSI